MGLFKRLAGSSTDASDPAVAPNEATPTAQFIQAAFWILLGRPAKPLELRDDERELQAGDTQAFLLRLLSSVEFTRGFTHWKEGRPRQDDQTAEEAALAALGDDRWFVERAYELVLGRAPDGPGFTHYTGDLAAGGKRSVLLRTLALSDEFGRRYRDLAPESGFLPRDAQLCELANPAKWDNPDWMRLLRDLKVVPVEKSSMHRKGYEFTQLLYGLERLGRLHDRTDVLSVGAGHEAILYWLANHVRSVVATDLYEEGRWNSCGGKEGDERVIRRPQDYAPFPYNEDRLVFLRMDGRQLAFRSGIFDVAYSLSSIEHFGGVPGAIAAIDEMARVVRPGGMLVLATEYILSGPPHDEVFQPAHVHALADRPGLRLVQPIDERVYQRYEYVAVDLYKNRFQTPHMVVRMGETVFTSAMMFLERI